MMLVRQQAQALIDARSTIVHGAVSIVHGAITKLEAEDGTTRFTVCEPSFANTVFKGASRPPLIVRTHVCATVRASVFTPTTTSVKPPRHDDRGE